MPDDGQLGAVLAAEAERGRAIAEQDWDALRDLLLPEYQHMHSTGHVDTRDEWIEDIRSRNVEIQRDRLVVRFVGDDVALLHGSEIKRKRGAGPNEPPAGWLLDVLQVWSWQNDRWRLAVAHATKIDS